MTCDGLLTPTQRHEHDVGHGAIPDGDIDHLLLAILPGYCDLPGGGGDGVDGAHEDVRHNKDGHEAVEEADQVESDPDPERPGDLEIIVKK